MPIRSDAPEDAARQEADPESLVMIEGGTAGVGVGCVNPSYGDVTCGAEGDFPFGVTLSDGTRHWDNLPEWEGVSAGGEGDEDRSASSVASGSIPTPPTAGSDPPFDPTVIGWLGEFDGAPCS